MSNPLRSLLAEPRPWAPPERIRRDWVLLAVVTLCAVLESLVREALPFPLLSLVVTVGLACLLLWRRTHPLAVVAAVFGVVTVVDLGLVAFGARPLDSFTMLYVLLLPYALFRWGSGREMAAGLGIIVVTVATSFALSWVGAGDVVGGVAVLLASFALGWGVRAQHAARERRLEQVKAEERLLLARELHDTVAHHVSAIAIRAQAARALASTSPSSPLEALEVIEVEASRTLAEMRAMVRALRNEGPAAYAPQPGVTDLQRLSVASPTGTRVEVSLSGDLAGLPPAIDAAVFRIAQEGVTNALRHARNATVVTVRVAGDPTGVQLSVHDDGDPDPGGPDPGAGGFGLAGMVERALLLGGSCHAGPRPDGGWAVVATLPRKVSA